MSLYVSETLTVIVAIMINKRNAFSLKGDDQNYHDPLVLNMINILSV